MNFPMTAPRPPSASRPRGLSRRSASGRSSRRLWLGPRPLEFLEARRLLATVPLTISFTWLAQVSNPDSDGTDGDYYARVKVGDNPEHVTARIEDDFFNPSAVNPSWTITEQVDITGGPVEVRVTLYDYDDFLNGADEPVDINPDPRFGSVLLLVNPVDGGWTGTVTSPSNVLEGDGLAGGNGLHRSHLEFEITTPFSGMPDSDGDGLFDVWEAKGIDLDGDGNPELDLPAMGADPYFKDIFLEMDWMPGAAPSREDIQAVKAAFAVAPLDAGIQASALPNGVDSRFNALFQPGIHLWVDTGNLRDARGRLVGDDFGLAGRGNQVNSANVSNLNDNYYAIKNANFDDVRRLVFHYDISATSPANLAGTSTGGNTSDPDIYFPTATLNDTTQNWVANEWGPGANGGPITVTITGGTGAGQTLKISANNANMLLLSGEWTTLPDATSTYQINWAWGGWGERGGNDFIDFNHNAATIMHELGHNLNLGHGGSDGTNYKPNYVSVMNYNVAFGIPQNSGGTILDYSPAKIAVGGTTASGPGTTLQDFSQSWATNQWAGGYVELGSPFGLATGGPTILNDPNQNWAVNQWAGTGVNVFDVAGGVQVRTILSNTATQFTVDSPLTLSPGWTIRYSLSTSLTQVRRIVSNTAKQLVFDEPWTFVPSSQTPYALYTTTQARGNAILPSITESALDETLVLDPTDTANRMIFTDGAGNLIQYPLNGINRNGTGPVDGPDYDGDGRVDTATVGVNASAPGDTEISDKPFVGHDDWRSISLSFRQFGDLKGGPVNLEDHAPPPLSEKLAANTLLNTTDLALSVTPSATTVFQGDHLVYTYTVSVGGPNQADVIAVMDKLPAGVDFVSATSSQGSAGLDGNVVTWNIGSVSPGVPATLRLEIIPYLVAAMNNTAFASTIDYDPNAANNTAPATVTVLNVPPQVTSVSLAASSINENDEAELTVVFTDPGKLDHHDAVIDWGDGPAQFVPIPWGNRQFTVRHRYLDDDPANTPSDAYAIHVVVRDDNDGVGSRDGSVRVNNLAPTLSNVAVTPAIDENGVVTLSGNIADSGTRDTFVLTVDWGEGTSQPFSYPAGTTHFDVTHRYRDDNPTATPFDGYPIGVVLKDDDTGSALASVQTVVRNLAPVITAFTSDATDCGDKAEGEAVHVSGTFTDTGILDTHSATIDWGDHSAPTTAAIVEESGLGTVAGSHVYVAGGIYRITISLVDDDTGRTTARTVALVTGVGILDGQLQVVGTRGSDSVTVNQTGDGQFQMHASFLKDSPRSLPSAGVSSIAMVLCEGNDSATVAGSITLPTLIDGGEGDDRLNGGNGPNILLGGAGNDEIKGGSGNDILVGGAGADRIVGNAGDDILIAGTLDGAPDPIDLFDQMLGILLEWNRYRNPARTRPKLVIGGDDDLDVLTGSAGNDWFFCDRSEDRATDRKQEAGENLG